jgi:hypothetical protein
MPEQPWTIDQAAEDLLAQIEELAGDGANSQDLVLALEREGLESATARELVHAVLGRDVPGPPKEEGAFGIEISQLRQLLRRNSPGADGQTQEVPAGLAAALIKRDVPHATAERAVQQLVATDRALTSGQQLRLRRLGLQGMIAAGLFGAFFAFASVAGSMVHLITVAICAALGGYSYLLWRRAP